MRASGKVGKMTDVASAAARGDKGEPVMLQPQFTPTQRRSAGAFEGAFAGAAPRLAGHLAPFSGAGSPPGVLRSSK